MIGMIGVCAVAVTCPELMPLLFIVQRLFEASTCANLQVLSAREEGAAVAVERKKSPTSWYRT